MSLLSQPNSDQYPSDQELSDANVDNSSETAKESEGKDRQRYASLGVSEQQLDGDDSIRFSLRQEPAPKVTKKGYAVFIYKKLKNGGYKLVPKMLSNDPGAPAQTWLNADTGYMKRDENGEPLQNTNGRASVSVNGSQAGGNKSNKLAWRPGKHLAMYPNASQFKSPDGTIPKDVIFFEVEYAADPDLHKQYQRNAWELGMNDNGQYRNNQGGLPYIPKDSYYLYRTNSISEGATPMIITGAYKINRALTDAEAKELNQNAGGMWCPRKGGDLTEEKLKDMGLDDKGLKKMTESFDMDTIKESHDESDEARLLPGYKSREINWEDKDLIHSIEENGQDINDYRDGYVAPEHSEEPTIRFSLDKDKGTVVSGFTGIKYPAGTIMGGAEEGDTNYVIFKPEDMKITEHTKFSLKSKPVRFEAGKKLSDEEKKEVLSTLKDAYKVNGVPYHIEETAGGKEKRVYEPTADSYVVSDITNRPLRYYITLPDGRVAHPTEVYPNISDNEVKSSATKQGLLDDEAYQIVSAAIGNMKDIADNAKAVEVLTELQNLPHETHDVGYGLNNAQSYNYKTGIFTSDAAQAIDYVVRRMRRKENIPAEIPAALKKAVADSYGMVDNLIDGMSSTKFSLKDNQGNPLNQDGTLKLDKIKSVDELTDEDFLHPTRNVELPSLPKKIADAIGTEGKPVVIKKNIFERNYMRHKDVTPELGKIIFKSALYNPDLYGQNQKKTRPYNWVLINTKDEKGNNRTVLLEVNSNKDNVEIVHWHFVNDKNLGLIKKQAIREGDQVLILPSEQSEEVGGLSNLTDDLSSAKIQQKVENQ